MDALPQHDPPAEVRAHREDLRKKRETSKPIPIVTDEEIAAAREAQGESPEELARRLVERAAKRARVADTCRRIMGA